MNARIFASVLGMVLSVGAAEAATEVTVNLGDAADDKSMAMTLDKTSAKAGPVEFDVTNLAKTKTHEMLVVPVKTANQTLPYDSKNDTVNELKVKSLGETGDMEPGAKKNVTFTLKPGVYALICNQPGHYHHGMKATFTVTP